MVDAGRKQLEQMLQQLQEQLQINLLQQTQLSSGPGKPNATAIQQLQQHQQQLVAQMQLTQQALMLGQSLDKETRQRERHQSETFGSTGSSDGSLKENRPDNNNGDLIPAFKFEQNGRNRHESSSGESKRSLPSPSTSSSSSTEKLFIHGRCDWPGCEMSCGDMSAFQRHLSNSHPLDDKATAQTRVQMQIVSQLEAQVNKEKDKLKAMMNHLHLETRNGELKEVYSKTSRSPSPKRIKPDLPVSPPPMSRNSLPIFPPLSLPNVPNLSSPHHQSPLSALTAAVRSPLLSGRTEPIANERSRASPMGRPSGSTATTTSNSAGGSIRPKPAAALVDSKNSFTLPPGFDERRGRGDRGNPNLDPEMDIKLNREFYKHNDVRPPYTYAALIRYAIHETHDQQLTLHEIYNWFTTTFMYFRRNAASWKNAVRHNLSLHKCFMRVENVKGAVWTVDDEEYHRRRPPRGVQSTSASNSPTLTPQTPSLLDQSLSSMLAAAGTGSSPSLFNHAAFMEHMRRGSPAAFPDMKAMAAVAAAVATSQASVNSSGIESPPHSLDNRSTPGSLDLSRVKAEHSPLSLLKTNEEEDEEMEEMEEEDEEDTKKVEQLDEMKHTDDNQVDRVTQSPKANEDNEELEDSSQVLQANNEDEIENRDEDAQDLSTQSIGKEEMKTGEDRDQEENHM